MPLSYKNDEDQDNRLNPFDSDYSTGQLEEAEQQAGQTASADPDDSSMSASESVNNLEKDAPQNEFGFESGRTSRGDSTSSQPRSVRQKISGFAKSTFTKKRTAIVGIVGLLGLGGGLIAGFFGLTNMVTGLAENLAFKNDSTSTSMQRRVTKVIASMAAEKGGIECQTSTKIKCKMGRISNRSLYQLEKKGIKPNGWDRKKTGYAQKKPTSYTFTANDGSTKTVKANDLTGFLLDKDNRKFAAKMLGTGGAINLRYTAWAGKFMSKFYSKFGINRLGGIADGTSKKLADAKKKFRERLPGSKKASEITGAIKDKVNKQMGKYKKGGAGYMIAIGGCIAVKAPGYIAAGVAAYQLAQIIPFVSEYILSPGEKIKASGVETKNSITPEQTDMVGTALTEQTKNKDGKMTSALDSKYLLAAMGANTGRPAISEKFTPGYAVMMSSVTKAAGQADEATKSACNAIMSPAAMYSAMAVDSAVTVAASATVVGGIFKLITGVAISIAVTEIAKSVLGFAAEKIIEDIAENDAIKKAKGEELGDVLGISAATFFSSGAMTRGLPALKESQLAAYDSVRQNNEQFKREMDIASLSPLDTSSPYTFLGSLSRQFSTALMTSGGYSFSPASALKLASMPLTAITNLVTPYAKAQSQEFSRNYCGYADDFGLNAETENGNSTPAINMAGMPCTGITPEQAGMTTDEAVDLLAKEGWLDDSIDVPEGATIDDLVDKGIIVKDTPLADFIETCTDPSSGEYLFNSAGCTTPGTGKSDKTFSNCGEKGNKCSIYEDEDKNEAVGNDRKSLENPRSQQAISVFLLDFQIAQSINGEDEEDFSAGGGGDSSNDSGSGEVPDGDAQELAKKILANKNITIASSGGSSNIGYRAQMQNIADGKPAENGITIDKPILQAILIAAEGDTKITISSIVRVKNFPGGRTTSRHNGGNAVDISQLGNCGIGRGGDCDKAIQRIADAGILKPSGGFGQNTCGSAGKANGIIDSAGLRTFKDTCNHLHIESKAKN